MRLEIPGLPRMPNRSVHRGVHWRQIRAEQKKWIQLVGWAVREVQGVVPEKPWARADVVYRRVACGVEPDYLNLVYSFKAVEDGLVRVGVLEDDKPSNYGRIDFQWVPTPSRASQRIVIEAAEWLPCFCGDSYEGECPRHGDGPL